MTEEQIKKFELLCEFARLRGFAPRQGPSRATNHAGTFRYNHWSHATIMPLYEGEQRTLKGKEKPEVCWVCIDEYGGIASVPARHLRMMDKKPGFGFIMSETWERIKDFIDYIKIQKEAI
jgi:hypothetical protein